jgi:LysM repeat protein
METRHRSPARFLAPLALVAAVVALAMVISTTGSGESSQSTGSDRAEEKARDLGDPATRREERRQAREDAEEEPTEDVYIVESGDTLGGIAEKTGVPVERLEELNPGLDQFQLVAGQRIKLR